MNILDHIHPDAINAYTRSLVQSESDLSAAERKAEFVRDFLKWAYEKDKITFWVYQQSVDEIDNVISENAALVLQKAQVESQGNQDVLTMKSHGAIPFLHRLSGLFRPLTKSQPDSQDRTIETLIYPASQRPLFIGMMVTVFLMSILGVSIYDRFFKTAQKSLAYPSAPVVAGRFLSFQGRLTDSLGNPITAATNMRFRLYSASSGGSTYYDSGTCSISPDQDGIHNVLIGSTCGSAIASSVFTENSDVYLGVTVGTDAEMTPRQRIANVPYAMNSETLQGLPPGSAVSNVPYINDGGDLLIAAAAPQIASTFASETFLVTSAQAITVQSAGTGDVTLNASGSGTLKFLTGGATAGVVNNSGNWGIKSTNPVNFELQVNGDVGPETDSAFDLGSNSIRWANVYADTLVGTTINPGFTSGSVVFADGSGNLAQDNASLYFDDTNNKLGLGTASPTGKLTLTGAATGKALAVLNETGDQNILTASASGVTVANLDRSGNLSIEGAINDISGNLVLNDTIDIGSATTGLNVTTAGVLSDIDGATVDINDNLDVSGTLTSGTANAFTVDASGNISTSGTTGLTFSSTGGVNLAGGTLTDSSDGVDVNDNLEVSGDTTLTGDLAVNGGDITSTGSSIKLEAAGTGTIGTIQVGQGGAGSTTPDYLGLDVKSSTGDPAGGFEGAMYYNTFDNKFRCYQGAAWTDCITSASGSAAWSSLTDPTTNLSLAMAEYTSTFTWNTADTAAAFDGLSLGITNDASTDATTQRLLVLNNNDDGGATGTTEGFLVLDNKDANEAVTKGIEILASSTGTITTAIDVSDAEIGTALSAGANDISATNWSITGASGNITTSGDLAVNGNDITSNAALTINSTSYTRIGDTASPASANGDDDLFVEGDLEVDGTFYADGGIDTTLTSGSVVFAGSSGVLAQDNAQFFFDDANNKLGLGTAAPDAKLQVTGAVTGKALTIFNETGDQDIIAASQSGNTRFRVANDGTVYAGYLLDISNTAYGIDPAGTSNFGGFSEKVTGGALLAYDAGNVGIGNQTPDGKLDVKGAATGKALTILDERGDQNILTASASGTTVANLDRSGNLAIEGAISDLSGATLAVNDNLDVSGTLTSGTADAFTVDATGNITSTGKINLGGVSALAYNALSDSGGSASHVSVNSDDDLYIEGELEVDGGVWADGTITANDIACTDCLDFTEFGDTMTLDAETHVNINNGNSLYYDLDTNGQFYIRDGTTNFVAFNDDSTTFWILPATGDIEINAATTDSTRTGGVIAMTIDAANAAVIGVNETFSQANGASTGVDAIASKISLTQSDADGDLFGLQIINKNTTSTGTTDDLLTLSNADTSSANGGTVDNAINIISSGATITDGIDITSSNVTNALNVGANKILGTTGLIDYDNFDFDASGNLSLAGTTGLTFSSTGGINLAGGTLVDSVDGVDVADNFEVSGDTTLAGDIAVNGNDITSNSNLTINAGGYVRIGDTATPSVATADDGLFVEGKLEVDGTANIGGGTLTLDNATSDTIDWGSDGAADPSTSSTGWKTKFYGNSYGYGVASGALWAVSDGSYRWYDNDTTTYNWKADLDMETDASFELYNNSIASTVLLNTNGASYFNGGNVGINTTGPDARLDSLATTEQLRLTYTDGSVYTSFTTDSGGDLTIDPTGGDIVADANFNPNTDDTYTLGTDAKRWKDIYLGPETLHIGTSTSDEGTVSYVTGTNVFTFTNNFGDTDFGSTSDGFNFTLGGGAGDDFIVDSTTLVVESDNDRVGIGTAAPDGKLHVTGASTGKALAILNETGDQNILAASASGVTKATLDRSGNLNIEGTIADLSGATLEVNDDLQIDGNDILDSGANTRITLGSTTTLTNTTLTLSGTTTLTASSLTALNCSDCADFDDLEDTLDLDAALTLNQSTNTWTQNFTGTTTDGLTYNGNSLSSGNLIKLSSTSTSFTGGFINADWSPGSSTTNSGDLFAINTGGSSNLTGNFINMKKNGSSLFKVAGGNGNVTTEGDLAINGGDITSSAGLTIDVNTDIITPDKLTVGSSSAGVGQLTVTGFQTGKALTILNETGDQNILSASASGSNRFLIGNNGDLSRGGSHGVNGLAGSDNMLPNGGFEVYNAGGSAPDDWTAVTGTIAKETTNIKQGSYSMSVSPSSSGWSTCIPVTHANTYALSGTGLCSAASCPAILTETVVQYSTRANCESDTSSLTTNTGSIGLTSAWGTLYKGSSFTIGNDGGATAAKWARIKMANGNGANTIYLDAVRFAPSSATVGLDLAETYPAATADHIQMGEIVAMGTQEKQIGADVNNIKRSTSAYDNLAFGVIATNPGIVLDDDKNYEKVNVALKGRVPVLVTTENGPIHIGDPITASSIPGVGMKATRSGKIIGYAMNEWTSPDPHEVDQVTVFVNPETYVDLSILTDMQNTLKNMPATIVNTVNAMTISTQHLVAQALEATSATIDSLIVDRIVGREITTTTLKAENVTAKNVTADTLETKDATISGTLVAGNVDAANIRELRERLERVASEQASGAANTSTEQLTADVADIQSYISELTDTQTPTDVADTDTYQLLDEQASMDPGTTTTTNGTPLPAGTLDSLTVTGAASMTSLTVADAFSAGNVFIQNNSIVSLVDDLQINSLQKISFMNGAVEIALDGTIHTKGEVIADKGVRTNSISPLASGDSVNVKVGSADFGIQNDAGDQVARIDASGSARFAGLSLDTYHDATSSAVVIAAGQNYRETGLYAPAIHTNAAASGNGILPEGQDDIIIFNDTITKDTVVNLTATSTTQNQSIYVDKIERCLNPGDEICRPYFRVALDNPINSDVTFNWLLIR